MIKTHEINLNTSLYNQLVNTNSAIIQNEVNRPIEQNDYILFKQVETIDEEIQETGLYIFVQVKNLVSNNPGLKEGYIMITYNQIQ